MRKEQFWCSVVNQFPNFNAWEDRSKKFKDKDRQQWKLEWWRVDWVHKRNPTDFFLWAVYDPTVTVTAPVNIFGILRCTASILYCFMWRCHQSDLLLWRRNMGRLEAMCWCGIPFWLSRSPSLNRRRVAILSTSKYDAGSFFEIDKALGWMFSLLPLLLLFFASSTAAS